MKIFKTVAAIQLFLLVTGSDVTAERRRVTCLYYGIQFTNTTLGTLHPENINASICTHLVYIPLENYTSGEIFLMPNDSRPRSDGMDIMPGLAQLKSLNPDLKLILHISYTHLLWDFLGSPEKSNLIQNGTKWLQENGFDGVDIPMPIVPAEIEDMVEFICELKTEFDKYGFIVTAQLEEIEAEDFPQPTQGKEDVVSKMARCCDHIVLRKSVINDTVTHRLAPLSLIKSNVDSFSKRGLPLNKTLITILTSGCVLTLADPKDTALGAKISERGNDKFNLGHIITNNETMGLLNSSMSWSFSREEESKEPYAFESVLWVSYEDSNSMEYKARYVMERGLLGILVDNLDMDDYGGTGGDGRFLLTRAIHHTFAGGD